jgi:hypothetical protein
MMLMAPEEKQEESMLPSVLHDTSKVSPMPRTSFICSRERETERERERNTDREREVMRNCAVSVIQLRGSSYSNTAQHSRVHVLTMDPSSSDHKVT